MRTAGAVGIGRGKGTITRQAHGGARIEQIFGLRQRIPTLCLQRSTASTKDLSR
jgi:hypothetical protein